MRYIECIGAGGPEVMRVAEMPPPEPGPGEVAIRVEAAGVNRPDLSQRQGTYPPPAGASPILGLEVAGTIVGTGERVCALVPGGGYAEYCVTPAVQCIPVPNGLTMDEAAGIPETFFTVGANVVQSGGLKAGEGILIHGVALRNATNATQRGRAGGEHGHVTGGSGPKRSGG